MATQTTTITRFEKLGIALSVHEVEEEVVNNTAIPVSGDDT